MHDSPAGKMVRCSKARAMFAMRACRKSVMIGTALSSRQMLAVRLLVLYQAMSRVLIAGFCLDRPTYGYHGPTMALPSWPTNHAPSFRHFRRRVGPAPPCRAGYQLECIWNYSCLTSVSCSSLTPLTLIRTRCTKLEFAVKAIDPTQRKSSANCRKRSLLHECFVLPVEVCRT